MSENSLELINEYKDQIRILRQEVAELQDAGKSKDSANKRCLQKLERTNEDLEEALKKIKLLEARQSDWKDEFVLVVLTLPILVIAYGVFSEDPAASEKIKEFFVQFQQLPSWFTNLWILVVASIYGIKGTQIFRNGKK